MEPNRTRQVIQDLARAFNKLASELTADLSYAAREIESLHKEVQRLRSSPGKSNKTNGHSRKSNGKSNKTNASSHKSSRTSVSPKNAPGNDAPKPAHEPGSFVFPQEPFGPDSPSEPTAAGNN